MIDERKLIRLGNSSFAIALPKQWITKSGLKKGDKVSIVQNSNGELIITSNFKKINGNNSEKSVDINNKDEKEIAREIVSAYVGGYKIITVNGEKDKLRLAKKIAKQFLNLELMEENNKKAVFKDLLDLEDVALEKFIRRMDTNLKEMFDLLIQVSRNPKKNKSKIKEIGEIDEDLTKFYFLIWRIMNIGIDNPTIQNSLKINPKSFIALFWISYNLEQIGDELKRIAKKIEKLKTLDEIYLTFLEITSENYSKSIKSFFDNNKELSREIILSEDNWIRMSDKLSKIAGFEAIAEKLKQINASIHHNSKMIFYNF